MKTILVSLVIAIAGVVAVGATYDNRMDVMYYENGYIRDGGGRVISSCVYGDSLDTETCAKFEGTLEVLPTESTTDNLQPAVDGQDTVTSEFLNTTGK